VMVGDLNGGLIVSKYSSGGTLVWSKQFGSSYGTGVAIDGAGNVFVTGYYMGGIDLGTGWLTGYGAYGVTFVVKYAADGTALWSKGFPSSGDGSGQGIAVDSNGNVLVGGYFGGVIDFGGGSISSLSASSAFLVKLSGANGAHQWSKAFGDIGGGQNATYGVAVDGSDNVFITGKFLGNANFGGGTVSSSGFDVFVAKFGSTGGHQWSKRFGGSAVDYGYAIAVAPNNDCVIGGSFRGTIDFGGGAMSDLSSYDDGFVVRLSSAGSFVWQKQIAGSAGAIDSVRGVAVDSRDNVLVTGGISGAYDFGGGSVAANYNDVFIAKYTSGGGYVWAKTFGDYSMDQGNAVTADSNGNVFVAGAWAVSVNLGDGVRQSLGGGDSFLLKLAP
jgi:uncharacterized protein (AIM24 family)